MSGKGIVGREDHTKETDAACRRLDSFARLLAGYSECVAVTLMDKKMYIAANELHPKHKGEQGGNRTYTTMVSVIEYFKKLANGENITSQQRRNFFCDFICTTGRFKEAARPQLAKQIAEEVMDLRDPTISQIVDEHSANFDIASRMYSEFSALFQDFLKLEEALRSDDLRFDEHKKVFGQLSADHIISKEEKGTHAEMQLLAEIIELETLSKGKGEIYIGISKLCCLGCRCMLEAANEELKDQDTQFLTRGRHDLDFQDNWVPPSKLREGFNAHIISTNSKLRSAQTKSKEISQHQEDIAFKIGLKGHQIISSCREAKEQAKTEVKEKLDADPMRASQSSSDAEYVENNKATKFQQKLSEKLDFIKHLKQQTSGHFEDSIELVDIAIKLYGLDDFMDFRKKLCGVTNKEILERAIINLINKYKEKYRTILDFETLKKIVEDPMLVEEEIASVCKLESVAEILGSLGQRFNVSKSGDSHSLEHAKNTEEQISRKRDILDEQTEGTQMETQEKKAKIKKFSPSK